MALIFKFLNIINYTLMYMYNNVHIFPLPVPYGCCFFVHALSFLKCFIWPSLKFVLQILINNIFSAQQMYKINKIIPQIALIACVSYMRARPFSRYKNSSYINTYLHILNVVHLINSSPARSRSSSSS